MKTKKLLSFMLAIVMVASMMATLGIYASAEAAADSTTFDMKVNRNRVCNCSGGKVRDFCPDCNPLTQSSCTTCGGSGTAEIDCTECGGKGVKSWTDTISVTVTGEIKVGSTLTAVNNTASVPVTFTFDNESSSIIANPYTVQTSDVGKTLNLCCEADSDKWDNLDNVVILGTVGANNDCWLDLDDSTTDILEKKELEQHYNLTVNEVKGTDVTKVKLSWEISDINAARTDNKVWNTTDLCWETSTSSTEIMQEGTAKFTLENYSSEKVNATVTFDTAEYADGKKFTAPTLAFDEDEDATTEDDGVITLDTANGNSTYSKTNPPKGKIDVTVTPDADDFKSLSATSSAAKYGTYTVTLSKAEYSITIDESILSICSLDSGCLTKIAPNGSATLTFTAKSEGESYPDLNSYNVTVTNADCGGNNWVASEYGETATLTISNPTGNVTVSLSECFAEGTKITMADGSKKNIEDITVGEKVLSFNHEIGKYEAQEVYLAYTGEGKDYGTELTFSDGTTLTIVGEHDLFQRESIKYVTLTRANAKANIGKHYYNAETGKFVELTSVKTTEPVNYYSLYTKYNYNCIANGMLSVPDDVDVFLNIYQFNDDLTANETQLQKDIATYGIYEYRADAPYSKADYDMLNMKYINIIVGKGFMTMNELSGARDEYLEQR